VTKENANAARAAAKKLLQYNNHRNNANHHRNCPWQRKFFDESPYNQTHVDGQQ